MTLPTALSRRVRALADERREHVQSMIAALIDHVVAEGLADGMLDALRKVERPGQGKLRAGGQVLTHYQAAILYLIGGNLDDDGWCRLSSDKLALLIGCRSSSAHSLLSSLERRRFIRRNARPYRRALQPWQPTSAGWDIWHDLARGEP